MIYSKYIHQNICGKQIWGKSNQNKTSDFRFWLNSCLLFLDIGTVFLAEELFWTVTVSMGIVNWSILIWKCWTNSLMTFSVVPKIIQGGSINESELLKVPIPVKMNWVIWETCKIRLNASTFLSPPRSWFFQPIKIEMFYNHEN